MSTPVPTRLLRSTPNFPNVAVDPDDSAHLFLGWGSNFSCSKDSQYIIYFKIANNGLALSRGWGSSGAGQGLWELAGGEWVYWDWCGGNSSDDSGCFEGERPDSMTQDFNTYTFAFGVDWASTEQRVITDGRILPLPPSAAAAAGSFDARTVKKHPLPYFTTSRGGIRAAWDPVNRRC